MADQIKNKTVCDILFTSGDSFRRYMIAGGNLKKVVPPMIEKKVISEEVGKLSKKTNDADLLLADMKHNMTLSDFIGYLEILIEFGSHEEYNGETRRLMRLMQGSLATIKSGENSEHDAVIKRFITVAFDSDPTEQTLLEGSQLEDRTYTQITSTSSQSIRTKEEHEQDIVTELGATPIETTTESAVTDSTTNAQDLKATLAETAESLVSSSYSPSHTSYTGHRAPNRPRAPPGQLGDAVSHYFTSEGGVLYSPIHGVTVTIPPNAIPRDVGKFLSMHFYLGYPFTVEEDVNLCSVVVWFHLHPHLEFLEDVTVKIPHAANPHDVSLCVLTWGEDKQGPSYKLDTEVPADFSDGYHAVFKVKHFSPYVVAKTARSSYGEDILHKPRNRKRTGTSKSLEKMNSDSIEKMY